MAVVERVSFAQYPIAAKLTLWGIDLHIGVLFGLANELLMVSLTLLLGFCMPVMGISLLIFYCVT